MTDAEILRAASIVRATPIEHTLSEEAAEALAGREEPARVDWLDALGTLFVLVVFVGLAIFLPDLGN